MNQSSGLFSVQAVGQEVILMSMAGLAMLTWLAYMLKPLFTKLYIKLVGDQIEHQNPVPPAPLEDDKCAICLEEHKAYEVSATCRHSYCGMCITDLYTTKQSKIDCPLCRKPITTMFKLYIDDPANQECSKISAIVLNYNRVYDDNRPLLRRLIELPYILSRLRAFICSGQFIIFFFRSLYFLRGILIILFYLLMPFDIIPESIFGVVGFIDDIVIGIVVILFMISIVGLIFLRRYPN